jgi:hypothetical protein
MPDHKKFLLSKKSVHINLEKETHAEMRSILFNVDLTMQDFFAGCARRLAGEDGNFIKLLDEIKEEKQNKTLEKMSSMDIEKIFDILESESPV